MLSEAKNLSAKLQAQIHAELKPGEQLIWTAQPLPRFFRRHAMMHVSFGIIWLAFTFSFFTAWLLLTHGHKVMTLEFVVPLVLVGIPFTFVGGLCLYSPFQISSRRALTAYALTDRRAIVFGCGDSVGTVKQQMQSYGRDMLGTVETRVRADGSGDLILEPLPKLRGTVILWTPRHGFMAIEHVEKVQALLPRLCCAMLEPDAQPHSDFEQPIETFISLAYPRAYANPAPPHPP